MAYYVPDAETKIIKIIKINSRCITNRTWNNIITEAENR